MTRVTILITVLAACGGSGNSKKPDGGAGSADAPMADAAPMWPGVVAIPLTTPDGSFWGPQLSIGGQMFMMDLDTGSTTTGVAGSACTSCSSVGVSPLYTPGQYAVDTHKTASTAYADGSMWSGEIYTDANGLAHGVPDVQLAIVDIKSQTQFFVDNTYQGIFGLGAIQNAEPNTGAYIDAIKQTGEPDIMAFELCSTGGTMWLGGFDQTHATAAPGYTPLIPISNQNPFYAIDLTGMSIGSTSVGTGAATFQEPVVDTGTTLFYVPTPVETAILNAINADTGYKALFGTQRLADNGCVTKAGVTAAMVDAMLPPLTLKMPNKAGGADLSYTVPPMWSYMMDAGNGMFCFGIGDGGTQDATTMGDMIMQAFVTVIDVDHQQVGFAPDLGCGVAPRVPRDMTTFHPHVPHRPLRAIGN